jgi:hypothetical protein
LLDVASGEQRVVIELLKNEHQPQRYERSQPYRIACPGDLHLNWTGGTILTSADDGVTWVRRESGTTNRLGGITYGNGQFAAFGWGYTPRNSGGGIWPGFILTSADGVDHA